MKIVLRTNLTIAMMDCTLEATRPLAAHPLLSCVEVGVNKTPGFLLFLPLETLLSTANTHTVLVIFRYCGCCCCCFLFWSSKTNCFNKNPVPVFFPTRSSQHHHTLYLFIFSRAQHTCFFFFYFGKLPTRYSIRY